MIDDHPYSSIQDPFHYSYRTYTRVAHGSAENISEGHRRPQNPVESTLGPNFTQDEAEKAPEGEATRVKAGLFDAFFV